MSEPAAYPLTLDLLFFSKMVVVAIPNFQGDQPVHLNPINKINVKKAPSGKERQYEAVMRTVVNPEQDNTQPYYIDMECIVLLSADETLSPEDAHRAATINGHSVAYGAIREAVSWMTSRQPYGSIMLGFSVLQKKPPPETVAHPSDEAKS